tara:strand:+ start:23726 stop:24463 length:738 start_codon:yes stop_codon:yes gene_type:complete
MATVEWSSDLPFTLPGSNVPQFTVQWWWRPRDPAQPATAAKRFDLTGLRQRCSPSRALHLPRANSITHTTAASTHARSSLSFALLYFARSLLDIMSYETDQYDQRDRSPRRRSRSPRRSRRSYSPRSRSRSRDRDEYRRSDRRSRSPNSGAQGAGGYQSSYAARGAPARSVEGKDNMMQSIRDSSQQDRRVYVGNLSYDVKWHHLKDFMRQGTASYRGNRRGLTRSQRVKFSSPTYYYCRMECQR